MATRKKASQKKSETQAVEAKTVRIRRQIPADMQAVFANNFVIRHTAEGDEFQIYFFQIDQPIHTSIDEVAEVPDFVDAQCVGRFVLTKERMGQMIAAMAENFAKCQSRLNASDEASTNASNNQDEKEDGKKQAG